jgi:hypothetical protein
VSIEYNTRVVLVKGKKMTALLDNQVRVFASPNNGVTMQGDRWVILRKLDDDNYVVTESWRSKEPAENAVKSLRDNAEKFQLERTYVLVDAHVVSVIL